MSNPLEDETSLETQRFIAHEGLVQWATACLTQRDRMKAGVMGLANSDDLRLHGMLMRSDQDFFINAASKLFAFKDWAWQLGLFSHINFREIEGFRRDVKDLRGIREHLTEHFRGKGKRRHRWLFEGSDASGGGTLIGGRLDHQAFTLAVERMLPGLLASPVPIVSSSDTPPQS